MIQRAIIALLPSAHWATATVIVLACGHRHVRPSSWPLEVGAEFDCCFCDDERNQQHPASDSSMTR